MKKILVLALALAMLSACEGKETVREEQNDNLISATEEIDISSLPETEEGEKTVSEEFAELEEVLVAVVENPNFKMEITFYFEDGKAVNSFVKGTYNDIAQAKGVYDSYLKNTEYYANVKREEGTITYTNTEAGFEAYKDKTYDEVKAIVEESGFTVK